MSRITCTTAVLSILAAVCVSGLDLKTVDDCPKFKDDGDDVTIKLYEDTCYYFYMTQTLTFEDSSSVCWGRGGTLVMPRSKDISDFLKKEITSYNTAEKTWVGMLQEKNSKGIMTYFWMNGQSLDSKFAAGVLEFADAFTVARRMGVWHFDKSDKDVKNHFVCEIKGENIHTPDGHHTVLTPFPTPPPITTTPSSASPTTADKNDEITCPIINGDRSHTITFGATCFYFQLTEMKSYENAAKFCESNHGYLALVKKQTIDSFLQRTLRVVFNRPRESMWIGLHSDRDSALPQYWDDGVSVSYTNFKYSFPIWSDYAMSAEDNWEAYPTGIRLHFICQFKGKVNQ